VQNGKGAGSSETEVTTSIGSLRNVLPWPRNYSIAVFTNTIIRRKKYHQPQKVAPSQFMVGLNSSHHTEHDKVQGHRASHLLLLQAEKELSCHVSTR
jgi:hypothetical protein